MNLREMFGFRVPIISVVIGEGGSGGALAIGETPENLEIYPSNSASVERLVSPHCHEGCTLITCTPLLAFPLLNNALVQLCICGSTSPSCVLTFQRTVHLAEPNDAVQAAQTTT